MPTRSPAAPFHSWREMKAILIAALKCESDSQRTAVIGRFCGEDARLKERIAAGLKDLPEVQKS